MYLALIPDADTIKVLKAYSPNLPEDVHLTVIHSKVIFDIEKLPLPDSVKLPITAAVAGAAVFGGKNKVNVLKCHATPLLELRAWAERVLLAQQLSWSSEWTFSPHVTVGKQVSSATKWNFLRFSRLEWRL